MKYNGHEDKETLQKGGRKIMTKGRKTAEPQSNRRKIPSIVSASLSMGKKV